jgi:hypothetical protein
MNIKVGDSITCTTPIGERWLLHSFPTVAEVTDTYIVDSRGCKWTRDGERIDTSSRWVLYEPKHEAMAAAEVSKMKDA